MNQLILSVCTILLLFSSCHSSVPETKPRPPVVVKGVEPVNSPTIQFGGTITKEKRP